MQQYGLRNLEPAIALGRGRAAELRGDCARAMAEYEKHRALSPSVTTTHANIARCLRKTGQVQQSVEMFQRTLRVQPFQPVVNYEVGLAYLDAGDRTRAIEHLERAVSVWSEADANYQRAAMARAKLAEVRVAS